MALQNKNGPRSRRQGADYRCALYRSDPDPESGQGPGSQQPSRRSPPAACESVSHPTPYRKEQVEQCADLGSHSAASPPRLMESTTNLRTEASSDLVYGAV